MNQRNSNFIQEGESSHKPVCPNEGEPDFLSRWHGAERLQIIHGGGEPLQELVLEAVQEGKVLFFFYWGGRLGILNGGSAGEIHFQPILRAVAPRFLFLVTGFSGVYFEGWCDLRREARVFRLDRCQFVPSQR